MNDVAALIADSHAQEARRYERAIREAESVEFDRRDRRAYSIYPSEVVAWLVGVPFCLVFLAACTWAIATGR